MRLRASGDRHEIRQQYLPLLWHRLVKELEERSREGIEDIIKLMDSYFLTKDDWDAILELGVGPMDEKNIKVDTQTKMAFTRTYNTQSHPLPFMKAGSIVAPKATSKDKPDLEEAFEESDDGEEIVDEVDEDDKPLDLKRDKYVKAAKKVKKSKAKKASAKGKGKNKVQEESAEEVEKDEDDGSEEVVKAPKGKGAGKGKAPASKGRAKK